MTWKAASVVGGVAGTAVIIFAAATLTAASGPVDPALVDQVARQQIQLIGTGDTDSVVVDAATVVVPLARSNAYTASATQSAWRAKLLGASIAAGVPKVTAVRVTDPGGADGLGEDAVYGVPAATPLPAGGCSAIAMSVVAESGAKVVGARSLATTIQACEVTVTALNPKGLLEGSYGQIGILEAALADKNHRAFLVTVLGVDGTPIGLVGWIPGLGGDVGQGISWSAPGVVSAAMPSGSSQ